MQSVTFSRMEPATRLPQEFEDELAGRKLGAPRHCELAACGAELPHRPTGRPRSFCSEAHKRTVIRHPELRIALSEPATDWWGPDEADWDGLLADVDWEDDSYGYGYSVYIKERPPLNDPVWTRLKARVIESPREIIGQPDRPAGWDRLAPVVRR